VIIIFDGGFLFKKISNLYAISICMILLKNNISWSLWECFIVMINMNLIIFSSFM